MTRFLSHNSFPVMPASAGLRPRAHAWMTQSGLTVVKVPTPNALVLRHAP